MKTIAIIGGGISGLALLHYLKQRFGTTVDITLYESQTEVGGCIRSLRKRGCIFESGPNCFLDFQPVTLQFIEELNLTDQLIEANPHARRRYIQFKGELVNVPMEPVSLIRTPLLSFKDKISLVGGLFKKNISTDRSIYDYVCQRFSVNIAERLVDPFISGIYAGDIKRLHMACAFPKFKRKRFQKTRMRTFIGGMGQIIESLYNRYKPYIQTNIKISLDQLKTDLVFIATPAYTAAGIIESVNPVLAQILQQIPYAPIAVVGLVFEQSAFKKVPDGFGFLIPSGENKDILGVLIESNVFEQRASQDQMMLRVMLGGAHHPSIVNNAPDQIYARALEEIDAVYGLKGKPLEKFIKIWPKAIPQYEISYPLWRQSIAQQCAKTPGLYLCANYLDGISFNDCINNVKSLASTVVI
ncbi:MAG: protoporphyrinogen oxidase [Candidatus Omnitrophica bacterium]|nr:protoporphyrinogen oxidase [Candidatus Omnitrophota bacterium]